MSPFNSSLDCPISFSNWGFASSKYWDFRFSEQHNIGGLPLSIFGKWGYAPPPNFLKFSLGAARGQGELYCLPQCKRRRGTEHPWGRVARFPNDISLVHPWYTPWMFLLLSEGLHFPTFPLEWSCRILARRRGGDRIAVLWALRAKNGAEGALIKFYIFRKNYLIKIP